MSDEAQQREQTQLRKPRQKTVDITVVDGEGNTETLSYVIAKIKVGQRRQVAADCTDERGIPDLDKASRLAAVACVVKSPDTGGPLTMEDIDELDTDEFLALSDHIATFSGLMSIAKIVTPDPEEGSEAVTGFPASA